MENIIKKLEKISVNPMYDINIGDTERIINYSKSTFEVAYNSFKVGYMQGQKAERAKQKRKCDLKK